MQSAAAWRRTFWIALAAIAAITALHIAILVTSPLQLYPDEAQYWWWALTPDLGYFSKPPLIAWIIRLTTFLFGDREWAIRLAIPILHGGAALLVFAIARMVYPDNARVALWSALAYLTTPGISYSSGLASTDPPLLFFWALALFAFLRALQSPGWRWHILCGMAVGLGILAKYAMVYFAIGAVLAMAARPDVRKAMVHGRGIALAVVAALVLAPNLVWNATHGFPTVAHVQTNAGWNHLQFNPVHAIAFLAGQFGVFGPVLMAAWFAAIWRIARSRTNPTNEAVLCTFSLPPLILIALQAVIAEANANWAATAFVAASPLAVAEIFRRWPRWSLPASFALHGTVLALLCAILVQPAIADRLGLGNVFKRQEGWKELADRVAARADGVFPVVAANNRSVMAELLYYARPRRFALLMWDQDLTSHNHFEMTLRLTSPAPRVLLVVGAEGASRVLSTFESTRLVETVSTPIGGGQSRSLRLYDARFYRGPQLRR